MDAPPEAIPWEMPVWPVKGQTWPPGSEVPVRNWVRAVRAIPPLANSFLRHPKLTANVLSPSQYGYQARSLSALYRLRKLCGVHQRYDVLHAHFGPVAKSFRFARRLWQAPLIASFHGYDFCTVPRKEGVQVYHELFATADLFTVNSDYTRAQVEKLGCPPEKIRKLPVGLALQEFPFSERRYQPGEPVRVITVGRLVEIKGHEYVIQALAKVHASGLSVRYDIVGDGPLRPKLQQLVGELGVDKLVVFHGARSSSEVRDLMEQAHIFVLASVSIEGDQEGQGLVVQEAQASGLPVIVTRHGALPEGLLPGRSGFVMPERDVGALANELTRLIGAHETWPKVGRAGRKFVEENYDIQKLNATLINFYRDAVKTFTLARR
jgi:colanic acid/amylovoran biosynthesis glycosyltransferase